MASFGLKSTCRHQALRAYCSSLYYCAFFSFYGKEECLYFYHPSLDMSFPRKTWAITTLLKVQRATWVVPRAVSWILGVILQVLRVPPWNCRRWTWNAITKVSLETVCCWICLIQKIFMKTNSRIKCSSPELIIF